MTKLQTNALRIAELMGWKYNPIFKQNTLDCNTYFADAVKISSNEELVELFSSYNGLMPIVFECNSKSPYGDIFNISIYYDSVVIYINFERDSSYYYETEPKFIEALQLACIKYLEIKHG